MKVIVINGTAQTGKDKFVSFFRKVSNYRVKNFSSVDRVKNVAEICFGWNGKKNEKSRKFLSDMKKAWSDFNDGPTNDVLNRIDIDTRYCVEKGKQVKNNLYFVHVREPREIDKIKEIYGDNCITILIRKDVEFIPDNYSDKNVEKYEYDIIINNPGNENDLLIEAEKFNEKLNKL